MIPERKAPPQKTQIGIADISAVLAILVLFAIFAFNVSANLQAAGIHPGFGFLFKEAGFDVSESFIAYSPEDSYLRVILAGVLNTVWIALTCIIVSSLVGVMFGLLSVGPSPIGRWLAMAYVDLFRNLPKILILLVLYAVAVNGLPHVRSALSVGPVHISNRAINFPTLIWTPDLLYLAGAITFSIVLLGINKWLKMSFGHANPKWLGPLISAVAMLLPLGTFLLLLFRIEVSVPVLRGFDYQGGGRVSLQFAVVALTLSIYHGAQIAEVVRGGLGAIPKGQTEAAMALGLTRWQSIRLVILPQVFRLIIPPMNNQYVNLIKNTSIAIAVGYSDLMSVSGTIINQSFKPLEMMLITMAIYLVLCLMMTSSLNHWHQRLTAREAR